MTTEPQQQPDVWTRLGRTVAQFFGFLLRLLFVILLAVGLGAGAYFGLPWVYRSLIEPVQTHTAQIALLNERLDKNRAAFDQSQAAQDERLTGLETGADAQRERIAAAESAVGENQAALATERAARATLAAQVATLQSERQALATDVARLPTAEARLNSAATEIAALKRGSALLRIRNDLLLARLQLGAENFGVVRQQLASTGPELKELVQSADALSEETRSALTVRLVAAEAQIAATPAAALEEMERIWAILDGSASAQPTPTPRP